MKHFSSSARSCRLIRGLFCILIVAGLLPDGFLGDLARADAPAPLPSRPAVAAGNAKQRDRQSTFLSDRQLNQRLAKAKDHVANGRNTRGIELLQSILDQSEDLFFEPSGEQSPHGLTIKSEAFHLIAGLSHEGRRLYQIQFGPTARQLLSAAKTANDVDGLEAVIRRFFHTDAGYEAAYLLATYHLDHSEPLAAALHLDRLRQCPQQSSQWEPMLSLKAAVCWSRAGLPERSLQALMELRANSERGHITLGDRQISFFEKEEQALDWLVSALGPQQEAAPAVEEIWSMFRGNPARNAANRSVNPIWDSQWSYPTIRTNNSDADSHFVGIEKQFKELEANYGGGNLRMMPAASPLVVTDVSPGPDDSRRIDLAVFRTLRNLKAVNLESGELIWESAVYDQTVEKILANYKPVHAKQNETSGRRIAPQPAALDTLLMQRAWRDLAVGTLSSDGESIFALEDIGLRGSELPVINRHRFAMPTGSHNKLMAFEVSSGKLMWEIGGGRRENELELGGTYFLGPPLPLDGKLYCLAEQSGELNLLVLDPRSGHQLWSQGFIQLQNGSGRPHLRRLAGMAPSYGQGILVCPTASGVAVAVDLSRRLLLWAYRYESDFQAAPRTRRAAFVARIAGRYDRHDLNDESRWTDSAPTIVTNRVLLTPKDSDELHCLSLIDGSPQWRQPRGQGLYLATVYDEKVILVGRMRVEALNLADGSHVWKEPIPIPRPSGRGVQTEHFYHLPLSTGEVATIDLHNGRLLARSKSRGNRIPGNLIAAGSTIVSQSADSLCGFRSLDALNAQIEGDLQKSSDDAEALLLRGELRLHQGNEKGGLDDLHRVIETNSSERARNLVAETLLEGLRIDFASYAQAIPELDKLVTDSRLRTRYLRRFAAGLHETGQFDAAFKEYLRLAGPETGQTELERVSDSLTVRSDRWVRPRLAEIYEEASPEKRLEMDAALQKEFATARSSGDPGALKKLLSCVRNLPVALDIRRALLDQLDEETDSLQVERILHQLRQLPDETVAASATARLASMLIREQRHVALLSMLIDDLREKWPRVVCLGNKTGEQLVHDWQDNKRLAELLSRRTVRQGRKFVARRTLSHDRFEQSFGISFRGPQGPYFEGWSFELDRIRSNLIARDGDGAEQWQLWIRESGRAIRNPYDGNYVTAHGRLLLVVLGHRFLVVDPLGTDDAPKILWQRDLHDLPPGRGGSYVFRAQPVAMPNGVRQKVLHDPFGRSVGTAGPITDDYLCFQAGTTLTAVEPFSGNTLWERMDVVRGSLVFGDEEYVVVVEPTSAYATVLRASDGTIMAERPVLGDGIRLWSGGRNVVTWLIDNRQGRLALSDVVTGGVTWEREFSNNAKVRIVKEEEIAVVEPNGRFVVLRLKDGHILVDCETEPFHVRSEVVIRRSKSRYLLLTYDPTLPVERAKSSSVQKQVNRGDEQKRPVPANLRKRGKSAVSLMAINQENRRVNGHVYAFDRTTGTKLWSRLVRQQAFKLSQPEDLPVLVFSLRVRKLTRSQPKSLRYQTSILVLDASNGQTVYSHSGKESTAQYGVASDPDEQKIDLKFMGWKLSLHATDKTDAQEQPAPSDAQPEKLPGVNRSPVGETTP
jgi:outer membrane protein assembly factor BamB